MKTQRQHRDLLSESDFYAMATAILIVAICTMFFNIFWIEKLGGAM